jgi:hypothetical protein
MANKPGTGRSTKQLPTGRPAGKKEIMPKLANTKSKKNYLGNAIKEVKEYGKAYKKADKASLSVTPGANARARSANANERAQRGQALGAVLQGRRYDNKTGKQIKK